MKLVILGGIHGAGKTTLLESVPHILKKKLTFFDPGEYFWHYVYEKKAMTGKEVEKMVVQKLIELKDKPVIVANWHYAVWRPEGYIPQISQELLVQVLKEIKPEKVYLLNITAPIMAIYARRLRSNKKRRLDPKSIIEEMQASKRLYADHASWLKMFMPVTQITIENLELEAALQQINMFFTSII